jgi:hypothetical protein
MACNPSELTAGKECVYYGLEPVSFEREKRL